MVTVFTNVYGFYENLRNFTHNHGYLQYFVNAVHTCADMESCIFKYIHEYLRYFQIFTNVYGICEYLRMFMVRLFTVLCKCCSYRCRRGMLHIYIYSRIFTVFTNIYECLWNFRIFTTFYEYLRYFVNAVHTWADVQSCIFTYIHEHLRYLRSFIVFANICKCLWYLRFFTNNHDYLRYFVNAVHTCTDVESCIFTYIHEYIRYLRIFTNV